MITVFLQSRSCSLRFYFVSSYENGNVKKKRNVTSVTICCFSKTRNCFVYDRNFYFYKICITAKELILYKALLESKKPSKKYKRHTDTAEINVMYGENTISARIL